MLSTMCYSKNSRNLVELIINLFQTFAHNTDVVRMLIASHPITLVLVNVGLITKGNRVVQVLDVDQNQ